MQANQSLYCCDTDSSTAGVQGATETKSGTPLLFRVVTQRYGVGIVDRTDVCDSMGNIFIEVDLSCPACISCSSVDGYVGSSASTIAAISRWQGSLFASLVAME